MATTWETTTPTCRSFAGTSLAQGDASDSQTYIDNGLDGGIGSQGESKGLYIYNSAGTEGKPLILLSFDLTSVPATIVPYSTKVRLTIGACNMLAPIGLEIYQVLKPLTVSSNARNYDSTNAWNVYLLGAGSDYNATLLDSVSVPESYTSGDTVEFDVSTAVSDILGSNDRVARFMIKPNYARYASAIANHEYLRFYTGNPQTGWAAGGASDQGYTFYPYTGNGTTDRPTIIIEDMGAVAFYLPDNYGQYSSYSVQVGQGVDYYDAGYVIPGASSTEWKMFIKNNLAGYLYDVRIWCDWARATIPQFTGTGTSTMGYISTINGNPGEGSPNTQAWKMTCISGGEINSVWSVQYDNNSYALYGSYSWVGASPDTLTCVGASGFYSSTPSTQGIAFYLTDANPVVGDYWLWDTYQNTVVPGANIDSESYIMIAPDISGAAGSWHKIQPPHTLISLPVTAGSTNINTVSVIDFEVGNDVVLTNMQNGQKYINTISSINITGSQLVLTGGTTVAFVPGDQIQVTPFRIGDMAPSAVSPFWLMLDVPDIGMGTGARSARLQVTEGQ